MIGGAAFGAVFLAWIAGARILDPTGIDWLMKGDWVPHHFGWHFFRIEPWRWPPGSIHSYYAPLGTSIGLTDSIPLAAYALKPFGGWLPAEFQYPGPWLLLSFTLQGALGARLVGRWIDSAWVQAAGGAFCVLLPMLLARVGHTALCSHWLVLWALLLATRTPPGGHAPLDGAGARRRTGAAVPSRDGPGHRRRGTPRQFAVAAGQTRAHLGGDRRRDGGRLVAVPASSSSAAATRSPRAGSATSR